MKFDISDIIHNANFSYYDVVVDSDTKYNTLYTMELNNFGIFHKGHIQEINLPYWNLITDIFRG